MPRHSEVKTPSVRSLIIIVTVAVNILGNSVMNRIGTG